MRRIVIINTLCLIFIMKMYSFKHYYITFISWVMRSWGDVPQWEYGGQRSTDGSLLSPFHHVGSRVQTQLIRFGNWCLYHLSYLTKTKRKHSALLQLYEFNIWEDIQSSERSSTVIQNKYNWTSKFHNLHFNIWNVKTES